MPARADGMDIVKKGTMRKNRHGSILTAAFTCQDDPRLYLADKPGDHRYLLNISARLSASTAGKMVSPPHRELPNLQAASQGVAPKYNRT